MRDVKTVDNPPISIADSLIAKQQEDVAKMRTSLLCCNGDPYSISQTIQKVTAMRVYHQVTRIVKYLDTMDRIEEKLYESIDYRLDTIDVTNSMSWATLLRLQEQLQSNMLQSQKLLEPYIKNFDTFIQPIDSVYDANDDVSMKSILPKHSRDIVRNAAQEVLSSLPICEVNTYGEDDSTKE